MGWFDSVKSPKLKNTRKTATITPDGLWKKCSNCGEIVQTTKLQDNLNVCPICDHHYPIGAQSRIDQIVDKDSFVIFKHEFKTTDPLQFVDKKTYLKRLDDTFQKTQKHEGTLAGIGKIFGKEVAIGAMDFHFMGGSMGVMCGERLSLVLENALNKKIPAIIVSCSGGARMQEGVLSLMQMAKTSALISRMREDGIPFISVLTDPTTGGVAASFAMLGDVNIAEPKALIGFAGPRVIEQSIRQVLPEGFQRSEFLLDHGFIDRIVHRNNLKKELSFFINMFGK